MSTPHINASKDQIASIVLMPGDPLRAKYIAETYLEDVIQFNEVRNMFGFTGTYKGKKISVMGHGMGMPSVGIYAHELYAFFGVETIIRIGSCGSYTDKLDLYDVVLGSSSWTESSFALAQSGVACNENYPDEALNLKIENKAKELNIELTKTKIHSNDVFYSSDPDRFNKIRESHGCSVVEMESFALFHVAKQLGKKAACLLTVSDSLVTKQETSAAERQTAFTKMMEIALESTL